MSSFKELKNIDICPCGSGKKYGVCCKNKKFKYGIKGDKLIKMVPIRKEVKLALKKMENIFFDYYGRKPKNDFVAAFSPIYNDEFLLHMVYIFRNLGFPEKKIYAYYKSDGLFPCDLNIDLLSKKDLEEFKSLCDEYTGLLNQSCERGLNNIQYVLASNSFLEKQIEYSMGAIIGSFNDFIRRHSMTNKITNYKMKKETDYCIFSALKTVKTLQSINKLRKEHLTECIYSLSRSILRIICICVILIWIIAYLRISSYQKSMKRTTHLIAIRMGVLIIIKLLIREI